MDVNLSSLTDPVSSQDFRPQMVYRNFKMLTTSGTTSRIHCAAHCLLVTNSHPCTTFNHADDDMICRCGVLKLSVTEPAMLENMYVNIPCQERIISGNAKMCDLTDLQWCHQTFGIVSGMFGILTTSDADVGAGLPALALGIEGATQCQPIASLPSTNLIEPGPMVLIEESIYVFGGKANTPEFHGSDAIYKYNLNVGSWTTMSTMIDKRISAQATHLGGKEVLITGTRS